MIELVIPGRGTLRLENLVCDVNGTLATDGKLNEGVRRALSDLRDRLNIVMVTADTHGRQDLIDQLLNMQSVRLTPGGEDQQKANLVRSLGAEKTAAIGQGENDSLMLAEAALGIAILSKEGTSISALTAADLLAPDILTALELFEKPLRIVATLRK